MDDLAGLDWKPDPPAPGSSTAQYGAFNSNSTFRSGRSTPLSTTQFSSNAPSMTSSAIKSSAAAANDTFSNLLAPKPSKPNGSLSLQERQKQLLEEKSRRDSETQNQYQTDAQYWEGLGSGKGTPVPPPTPSPEPVLGMQKASHQVQSNDDDDILSAFNSSTAVDSSSYYPPPRLKSVSQSQPSESQPVASAADNHFDEDDDPFGLSELPQKTVAKPALAVVSPGEDDDILGMLGQPVSQKPTPTSRRELADDLGNGSSADAAGGHPADAALAELVEMGFPADRARDALEHTETGTDVQAAVGWLLTKAHEESKSRSRPREEERSSSQSRPWTEQESRSGSTIPAWARQQDSQDLPNASRSSSSGEKDVKQYATELSSTFLKSANLLWRTSQKKVQQAITEYKQEGDSAQPKWMRETQPADSNSSQEQRQISNGNVANGNTIPTESHVTDEALLLESGRAAPPAKPPRKPQLDAKSASNKATQPRQQADVAAFGRRPSPTFPTQPIQQRRVVERLSKQSVDEESAHAYISPARRRKLPTKVQDPEPTLDIFSEESVRAIGIAKAPVRPSSNPVSIRPKVSTRQFSAASPASLAAAQSNRQKGTEAFKRGDYAEAHILYSNALSSLSENHPVAIVVRCNRALTNTKVGDPRAAIADADAALSIIGPSQGEGEKISLGGGETDKEMKEFFGKALMRKAEALEHMEKWPEAAKVWREAVAAGVGGPVSIQGRNRCEKAAGISTSNSQSKKPPTPAATSIQAKKPPPRSAFNDLNGSMNPGAEAEAVKRLRAANAAAEAASDEAFALSDIVDARLVAWRTGKAENLRALLASLDTVLWPEAGWTKVGMGDLVLPPRVKIIYMKAIAKVHPDKISPSATTEQRMISGSVFAALNEAWDSFKRDNGL